MELQRKKELRRLTKGIDALLFPRFKNLKMKHLIKLLLVVVSSLVVSCSSNKELLAKNAMDLNEVKSLKKYYYEQLSSLKTKSEINYVEARLHDLNDIETKLEIAKLKLAKK
jgi:hypothetical protein